MVAGGVTGGPAATFADAVRSEWTKFRTVRSTGYTLAAVVVLAFGFAVMFSAGSGNMYSKRSAADQSGFDPTNVSLQGGILLTQLAIGVLGVLVVTSEYATGMIRTSLTAVPHRRRLLAAKALVFTAVALVVGQLAGFGAFLVGQPVLGSVGAPHTGLSQPDVLRAVIGAGLFLALVGLLGVGCGFLLRSTAGGISATVVITLIVPLMLGFLPPWAREFYPITAGEQVTAVDRSAGNLPPWTGFGLLCAAVLALLVAAYAAFQARDA
jgi:hypothetical protein